MGLKVAALPTDTAPSRRSSRRLTSRNRSDRRRVERRVAPRPTRPTARYTAHDEMHGGRVNLVLEIDPQLWEEQRDDFFEEGQGDGGVGGELGG